ncbi:Heme-degrading monooxygenase HmoA [Cyclobacterium lianum]|uniref:Heme-degrading monooxygenase HmoA n=1 Tax=Cyclobacterium lianum TaxID=388280 RepID=A0A1M7N3B5_9BACT|nr:antibiotic biosynthesis monooxygenase [Cyclobacterium lianum]SHM98002.1 Heme-degrading monooxygenase HmoA [Cyclobacterium lianum]
MIANTPDPPYYAVIFSALRTDENEGYAEMADLMMELASRQEGFFGVESARNHLGITVSYWKDLESINKWKQHSDHIIAQKKGRTDWYKIYKTRIAKVERDYEFEKTNSEPTTLSRDNTG